MIKDSSILQKSKISVVIYDMDRSDRIAFIFDSNTDVFISQNIIPVHIYSWTFNEHVSVASKRFIVSWCQMEGIHIHLPNIVSQIVEDCVSSIWSKLKRSSYDIVFDGSEPTDRWKFRILKSK